MIGSLFTELGSVFIDLFVKEEEARRAAKASLAATVGAALAPIDPASSAACGAKALKEAIAAGVRVPEDKAILDAGGDTLSGLLGGSWIEMAKTAGGAGVGGVVGATSGSSDGIATGICTGASLLRGDLGTIAGKAAGASLLGAAALTLDPEQRAEAVKLGLSLGSSLGGASVQLGGLADAELTTQLETSDINALAGLDSPAPLTADQLRARGLRTLLGELGGVGLGSVLHLSRKNKGGSTLWGDLGRSRGAGAAAYDLSTAPRAETTLGERLAPTAALAACATDWHAELTLSEKLDRARRAASQGSGLAALYAEQLEAELEAHRAASRVLANTDGLSDALDIVNRYRGRR